MNIEKITNDEIKNYLFFEADNPILSNSYKKGILKQALAITKKLISTFISKHDNIDIADKKIAVTFFLNEEKSAFQNGKLLKYDTHLRLTFKDYRFAVAELGFLKVMFYIGLFYFQNLRHRNWSHFRVIGSPLSGYLLYVSWMQLMHRSKPRRVFLFNCVHPSSLGILLACQKHNIDVQYCEHAVTSRLMVESCKNFRKLYVNYAFTKNMLIDFGLDIDSVNTLHNELYYEPVALGKISKIGVCLNNLDKITDYERLVKQLKVTTLRISIRVHDAHPEFRSIERKFHKLGCLVESAKFYSIDDFLDRQDLIVAGNSNVLSDAIMKKKTCCYLWTGTAKIYDYYGLVRAYGIPAFTSVEQLITHIFEKNH